MRIVVAMTSTAIAGAFTKGPVAQWLALPHDNPDFAVTPDDLALTMERLRATHMAPPRPVLVLAGYRAWRIMVAHTARRLHDLVGGPEDMFEPLAYPHCGDIDRIARLVVRHVEKTWPNREPHRTTEIDVVGVSMGGLVARLAAQLPLEDGQKRLRIARLFTLGTPHNGAILAGKIALDRAAKDMKPGSAFLDRLNSGLPSAKYELVCYARLNDRWVGATRCAPPGREPHWVSGTRMFSHATITTDERILADIALRIRGEAPISRKATRPPMD